MDEETIIALIKKKLLAGERLTVLGATRDCHTTELRKFISILRKTMNIKTHPVPRPGLKPYDEYYLDKTAA